MGNKLCLPYLGGFLPLGIIIIALKPSVNAIEDAIEDEICSRFYSYMV